ncbi:MAG: hypothetical protein HFI75_11810, partial [Lachnospiraceae bacterium]|nr:hypothetical protein [Lachnospiraceae bacterium]
VGNTFASIFLIDLTIISILFIKNLIEWYRRKEYFKTIRERVEGMEHPWLIAELLPVSYRAEDKLYQELLRLVGSSAIEQIHKIEDEEREYEEYIEEWIHEVKAPITSMQLMIENRDGDNPVIITQDSERLYYIIEYHKILLSKTKNLTKKCRLSQV